MMSISGYRAWMITKSRRERDWITLHHVYGLLGILITLSLLLPTLMILLPKEGHVFYDPYTATCVPAIQNRKEGTLLGGMFLIPPLLLTFICNTCTMCFMKCRGSELRGNTVSYRRSYVTLSLIYWCLLISYLPVLLQTFFITLPDWYYLFRIYVMSLNVIINPFIYFGTMKSFRKFARRLFCCELDKVGTEAAETTDFSR